jgi:hypothetical protein
VHQHLRAGQVSAAGGLVAVELSRRVGILQREDEGRLPAVEGREEEDRRRGDVPDIGVELGHRQATANVFAVEEPTRALDADRLVEPIFLLGQPCLAERRQIDRHGTDPPAVMADEAKPLLFGVIPEPIFEV